MINYLKYYSQNKFVNPCEMPLTSLLTVPSKTKESEYVLIHSNDPSDSPCTSENVETIHKDRLMRWIKKGEVYEWLKTREKDII